MSWPLVKLNDVAVFIRNGVSIKQSSDANGLRITRIETIANRVVNLEKCGYANLNSNEYRDYRLKKGDILISHINSEKHLGKCAIFEYSFPDVVHGMNLLCFRSNERVESKYLFYYLSSKRFLSLLPNITKKSVNQASFTVTNFKELEIPLPPLKEQQRIAAILDKADAIRQKRKQAIELADEFLRSVFLDMFGDPVTNPKGWEIKPLNKFTEVVTGNTPPRKDPENYGDHIEWIKSDNINTPSHYLTEATEKLSEQGKMKGRVVMEGAVLMTCIAGSLSCIGNIAMTDREVTFNQQINAIVPTEDSISEYIYGLMLVSKKQIQEHSTNAMKGMISKGVLSTINFPCPPKAEQQKYAKVFQAYMITMNNLNSQTQQANELFNSLSQKAFSGQL